MQYIDDVSQINKVLEIMGPSAGFCDGSGNVYFGAGQGSVMAVPEEADADSEGFVKNAESDKVFCLVHSRSQETVWVFQSLKAFNNDNSEQQKKLMKVTATLAEPYFISVTGQKNAFFKQLLIGGIQAVNANEFAIQTKTLAERASEFIIIRAELQGANKEPYDNPTLTQLEECLRMVFAPSEGFVHVRIAMSVIAVICPINELYPSKTIQTMAETLKATTISELMVPVSVAIGAKVRSLNKIDAAYKSAERAAVIGGTFEISENCYAYDKLGVARLLYGISKETCLSYLREIFGQQFIDERTKKIKQSEFNDELVNTIKSFLENSLNVSETARVLYIHRNTLIYRIDKFNKLTGLDCTKFEDGVKIEIGLMLLKYLPKL